MNIDSSKYFAHRKNRIQNTTEIKTKRMSKLNFLAQLFSATFVVIFIAVVISIMKYSSKMDIEYTKGELQLSTNTVNSISTFGASDEDEVQKQIDKRLLLIQQEENAPSTINTKNKTKEYSETNTLNNIGKIEKQKKHDDIKQNNTNTQNEKTQKKILAKNTDFSNNVPIVSKVLIGRYDTHEEAQILQNDIKSINPTLSPFVKKIGDIYSVQMGSYQDFIVAKNHAQTLKNKGFDVWIYQQ